MIKSRRDMARQIRIAAADLAHARPINFHITNGDEGLYASAHYAMSFTKGLQHDSETLLVTDPADFEAFRREIMNGFVLPFTTQVNGVMDNPRKWEAPTAGHVYSLQGPDAQAVTMAPAPELESLELIYEMAEVYELALLRDVPLDAFETGANDPKVEDACTRLNALAIPRDDFPNRPRKIKPNSKDGKVTPETVFRGSTRGVDVGPYLSQFMRMGTETRDKAQKPEAGLIVYGAQSINQRVPKAVSGQDYLMDEASYLDAQNGRDLKPTTEFDDVPRFITTPRDLATYVHYDALYQAYLNACLILLGHGAPFDQNFDQLSGMGTAETNNAGGFALWGGPHILTLVTEVATRALKAVRFQKFNIHRRLRPEALAARVHKADELEHRYPSLMGRIAAMRDALSKKPRGASSSLLDAIRAHTGNTDSTALLPMAFAEGSPMHPAYGAGHATVAGACVTILKAFFETSAVLVRRGDDVGFKRMQPGDEMVRYDLKPDGTLQVAVSDVALTLEGELNKLAANISIGRNMAGVHYFSDYYDSLRMGEEIAIGILEEQALTYRKDDFVMQLPTFDGPTRTIGETVVA